MSEFYLSKKDIEDPFQKKIKRISTSFIIFFSTFIIAHFFHQYLVDSFSSSLNYKSIITLQKVAVSPAYPAFWSVMRVLFVHGGPPFVCLLLSLVLLYILRKVQETVNLFRFFLLWLHLNLVIVFLVFLASASIGVDKYSSVFYQGYAVVGAWLGIPILLMFIISAIALGLAVAWGYVISKEFLGFSNTHSIVQTRKGRLYMIRLLLLWPTVISIPIMFAITLPKFTFFFLFYSLIMFFITLGAYMRYDSDKGYISRSKRDVTNRMSLDLLIVLIILLVAIRYYY